MAVPGTA